MNNFVRVPENDWQGICDSVRAKTGGTEALKSGEIKPLIDGIQAVGSDALELLYETTFSVVESIPTSTKTTLATLDTGLTKDDFEAGSLYIVAIKCTNDTEIDFSFSHFMERTQLIADSGGGYMVVQNSGIIYFYRSDTDKISMYAGGNQGVAISGTGRYVKSLTVQAWGGINSGGFAVSGDYNLKLYKVNLDFLGLEGMPDA